MQTVNILTTSNFKSQLYFIPLRIHASDLKEAGFYFRYFYKISKKLWDADRLLVDRKFTEEQWKNDREGFIEFVSMASQRCGRLLWLDSGASSGNIDPDVLPLVHTYYKPILLKDKKQYLVPHYSNRVFSDFYHKHFDLTDLKPVEPLYLRSEKYLSKIKLYWNYSLAGAYDRKSRNRLLLRRLFPFQEKYHVGFVPPGRDRPIDISCRIGLGSYRKTVAFQREKIAALLEENFHVDTSRLSSKEYFKDLKKAKICLSPFGWGEICYRDFEAILHGSALMKPDMDHVLTWPDLYQKDKTYIGFKWDLSDLIERAEYFLKSEERIRIAENAQELYRGHLYSGQGRKEFIKRAKQVFE